MKLIVRMKYECEGLKGTVYTCRKVKKLAQGSREWH